MIRKEKWVFDSNPSVTKDKQFVAYVTQGPAAGALIHPSGPEALMGRRQP